MALKKIQYIFTPNSGKTGTSALAKWLVDNKLATNVVDGVKEPHLLLNENFNYQDLEHTALPYLDTSVDCTTDPGDVDRFPPNSLVLFCLRNPLNRLFSRYKMVKIEALQKDTREYYSQSIGIEPHEIAAFYA